MHCKLNIERTPLTAAHVPPKHTCEVETACPKGAKPGQQQLLPSYTALASAVAATPQPLNTETNWPPLMLHHCCREWPASSSCLATHRKLDRPRLRQWHNCHEPQASVNETPSTKHQLTSCTTRAHSRTAAPSAHTMFHHAHTPSPENIAWGDPTHTPIVTLSYSTPGDTTHTASVYWHPPENTPVPARNASKAAHRSCGGSKAPL
jgi:hypothetical protein